MKRALLLAFLCAVAYPAYADPMDDIAKEIFDDQFSQGKAEIKPSLRQCARDSDCTAALILCRWRPVNTRAEQRVSAVAGQVKPECKWPQPPATPPKVSCVERVCEIAPDGLYY